MIFYIPMLQYAQASGKTVSTGSLGPVERESKQL